MKAIDSGHHYHLSVYDGDGEQSLIFMKREGDGYPFNIGHHPGTNCQEVLRAVIDRVLYLQSQIPCVENDAIIDNLRSAIYLFELRAARRHGRELCTHSIDIENVYACTQCGHIDCDHRKSP